MLWARSRSERRGAVGPGWMRTSEEGGRSSGGGIGRRRSSGGGRGRMRSSGGGIGRRKRRLRRQMRPLGSLMVYVREPLSVFIVVPVLSQRRVVGFCMRTR